jgi:hypothetical protein
MSDRLAQAQLKRQGKSARAAANIQATSSLLSGAAQTAQLGAAYVKSKKEL